MSLSGVSVDFPVYHASARSMRRFALQGAFAGRFDFGPRIPVIRALSDIDLEVREGDRLALIGDNGAGKSTLLRTMAGVYAPRAGIVRRSGRLTPLLSPGLGLHRAATGLENIFLLGMHLDIPQSQMRGHVEEIVAWTELGPFIGAPLATYSAGMIMRLAFAVSTSFPPDILLMDEWLGIGDAAFQAKAYERMSAFVDRTSILVLASQSAELLRTWCAQAIWLDSGRIRARGAVEELLRLSSPQGQETGGSEAPQTS
jgi:ABC-2 type transport system ATP-binding protein/lipopolysaccharide transport system ATP-binding protein